MSSAPTRGAVNTFFKAHVSPALHRRGYSQQGRVYRLVSAMLDTVAVDFQVSAGTWRYEYRFYVNLALVPEPWLDYMRSAIPDLANQQAQASAGLITARLDPPHGFQWVLGTSVEAAHEMGETIVAALRPRLDELEGWLDREALLARLRSGDPLPGWTYSPDIVTVVLLVDGGSSPELEDLLLGLGGESQKFETWAWTRSARSGSALGGPHADPHQIL